MRTIIRNFLKRFGYDIVKTGIPYIPSSKKDGTVLVGKFPITMPGSNVQLINYQLYPDLNAQFGRLAKFIFNKHSQMWVVDVGANVGDTIAVLKSSVDVPVIGIEGDDISYSFLEKNIKQFSNVVTIKSFLGERTERMNVNLDKSGWNTTLIPTEGSLQEIMLKTLDDVLRENNLSGKDIKLLKVDVEGFDTIVLRGASTLIAEHKPVLFFEYNRQNMIGINEEGLSTVLSFKKFGYNKIVFFDHKGSLVLATNLDNQEVITYLHQYISSKHNLMGYYDICIFHADDEKVADDFLSSEKNYM